MRISTFLRLLALCIIEKLQRHKLTKLRIGLCFLLLCKAGAKACGRRVGVRRQSRFMTHDVKHERCFAPHASTTTVSSQSQQQAHERSEQPAHTLSSRGINPAVRITATAPAGRTHPGASTEPGSATPLLASSGTTEVCSTVVTAERAAGRGDAIIVVQEAPARPPAVVMRALGGATTKASATGARHRRGSTAESFMALVLLCF